MTYPNVVCQDITKIFMFILDFYGIVNMFVLVRSSLTLKQVDLVFENTFFLMTFMTEIDSKRTHPSVSC